jgi:hypothetical protein
VNPSTSLKHFLPFPPGATQLLEVFTNGPDSGIGQGFGAVTPKSASVFVFVLRGQVGMGISLGGGGGLISNFSNLPLTLKWEPLSVAKLPPLVNEFFVSRGCVLSLV